MKIFGRCPGFPSRRVYEEVLPGRAPDKVAEEILELLGTGETRELEEIAEKVDLPKENVEEILDFMIKSGLVRRSVRITDLGLEFLKLPAEG